MPVDPVVPDPAVLLVLPVPVTVPELEPVASRPRSRGAFASVDVEWRDVSDVLRPLARCRVFIEPWTWLQSQMQSLPSLSLPITWPEDVPRLELDVPTDAVSRVEVLVDAPPLRSDVVVDEDVLPVEAPGVPFASSVEVVVSLFGVVVLLLLLELGVAVLLVLLLGLARSVPVCAIAAGAARAMARIAVGASFIGYPPLSGIALRTQWR